jgi:hypothetical protein
MKLDLRRNKKKRKENTKEEHNNRMFKPDTNRSKENGDEGLAGKPNHRQNEANRLKAEAIETV